MLHYEVVLILIFSHDTVVVLTSFFSPVPNTNNPCHSLNMFMQVSAESANQFGELVADPVTKELLHYTEKPETFVCMQSKKHTWLSFRICVVLPFFDSSLFIIITISGE